MLYYREIRERRDLFHMMWGIIFGLSAVSGVVQAVTGFGAAILLMLAMPYYFDMLQAPAITSTITLGITAGLAWTYRKHLDFKAILLPTIAYELGSMVTLHFAGGLDLELVGLAFGVFLIAIALYFIFVPPSFSVQANFLSATLCGLISGVCSALFGIGGPLMAMYFLVATKTKESYIGSLQFSFAVTTTINLIIRIQKGFYTLSFLPITILGIVGITLGKQLGVKILAKINVDLMRKLVYILVGISGVMTLFEHLRL